MGEIYDDFKGVIDILNAVLTAYVIRDRIELARIKRIGIRADLNENRVITVVFQIIENGFHQFGKARFVPLLITVTVDRQKVELCQPNRFDVGMVKRFIGILGYRKLGQNRFAIVFVSVFSVLVFSVFVFFIFACFAV